MKKTYDKETAYALLERAASSAKNFPIDPYSVEFFSLRNVSKNVWKFWVFTPDDALSPDEIVSGLFLENGYMREISDKKMKEAFPRSALEDLREIRLMFVYHTNNIRHFLIPTSGFMATFVKCLGGNGKIFREVVSLNRDLFLAEAMTLIDGLHFIARGTKNIYRVLACVTKTYHFVPQTIAIEAAEELKGKFISCEISDTLTRINYVFPEKSQGNYTPGFQFVFSDSADSSTIVRLIIHMGADTFIYLDDMSMTHRKEVSTSDLVEAVRAMEKETPYPVKKLNALKRKKCGSAEDAIGLFKDVCKAAKLHSAIGSKKMSEVLNESSEYLSSIDEDYEDEHRKPRPWTYEDIIVEFVGILSRYDLISSTAERTRKMMIQGIEYLAKKKK